MWKKPFILRWRSLLAGVIALLIFVPSTLHAQGQDKAGQTNETNRLPATNLVILVIENNVQVLRAGTQVWEAARTNQVLAPGDHIRTGPRSRAAVLLSNQTTVRLDEKSEFLIETPPEAAGAKARRLILNFVAGALHFLHRDPPTEMEIRMRSSTAAVRGTDFAMQLLEDGTAIVTVIDGNVELTNNLGSQTITNRQQGIVHPGRAPVVRPAITAINNIIQWTLYYPGILDPAELQLTEPERAALDPSLAAYNSGDLLDAVAKYPAGRAPQSQAERIYFAALLLSVGRVDEAEAQLSLFSPAVATAGLDATRLVNALRELIATVKLFAAPPIVNPQLATEWLAESYRRQSLAQLEEALKAARNAAAKSPNFGFTWARVAELEFSFGRINDSSDALQKALQFSPRNAQAIALNGFLYAAKNKINSAKQEFQRAIDIDGALANAWLGRGLCRIRQGDAEGGREDLLVAAALEPQRALLRSYLGKAYAETGDRKRAEHELDLAKDFDPRDPTAWLYSALLKQQYSQINDAIRNLEHAQDLSTNRAVFRSQLLLDQDRAVGSANLAHMYRDAGMVDWSVQEAGKAVSYDYGNYSAHLFLANSYDELRDPNRINLRYETPAESEYVIANLLAPVDAGPLSQTISQGEYSKLFERNRLGLVSSTEYLSRGAWIENAAQFGTFDNTSYSIESLYRSDRGQRPNNDLQELELRFHLKQQITPQDSLYLRTEYRNTEAGDVGQYYDPQNASLGLRTREEEPLLHLGYHHEWQPGVHTLFLAGRLFDRFSVSNPLQPTYLSIGELSAPIEGVEPMWANLHYRAEQETYTAELQQTLEIDKHQVIAGVRYQNGEFRTRSLQTDPVFPGDIGPGLFESNVVADQDIRSAFERFGIYGYDYWQVAPRLQITGGLSYDRTAFPRNFRFPPLSDGEESIDQISPKAGVVWRMWRETTLRFAYTRSLSGASIDQAIQLEPTQVAGLNQSFRGIIPDVSAANAGAKFETFSLALEKEFSTRTYISLDGQILNSKLTRDVGMFGLNIDLQRFAQPSDMPESLNYQERNLQLTVNQLLGDQFSLAASYRVSDASYKSDFTAVPEDALQVAGFQTHSDLTAILHRAGLEAIYNHPCGFFMDFQGYWYEQSSGGYTPELPESDFWQLNAFVGYRFLHRRAELRLGLLNLTDSDYRLNPLNIYNDLPRSRTLTVRLRISL